MNKRKHLMVMIVLLAAYVCAAWIGILSGASGLDSRELFAPEHRQILQLRIARVVLASIAGAGLAVCGIALQAVLRNPLAEPYLLGTSSGAGLGAVAAILLGMHRFGLPLFSFAGAVAVVFLVYSLARQGGRVPLHSLVLSGVIVSIACSGVIVFLISISSNEALHGAMWWLWGSTQVYDVELLSLVTAAVVAGCIWIYVLAQDLNAISLGEEAAQSLGIDYERTKRLLFFVTSFMTAGLVAVCGIIGFVGLVVPHAMRMVVGPNHKALIPAAAVASAAFMVACDLVSRTVFAPMEIPIGVITACVGAPVFIWLLKRSQEIR
jgi:iron complex transport system permease protein